MIKVEVVDQGVIQALTRLANATHHLPTVLDQIGDMLIYSTKQRFATSTGPDGQRWASNSQVTILRYLGKYKGSYGKKTGKLTKTGAGRVMGKRPLIGETGDLSRQIAKSVDGNTLYIGSTMLYAAAQQFGAKNHQFQGRAPWGDIPARPFLGLSDQDRTNILDTISDYLTDSLRP
jgi:phage virion morphogenesis protein